MSYPQPRTSKTHPLEVDFLEPDVLGLPGCLGMTILPGVKDPGRWDRELEPDLLRLKRHYEADTLVTLLERKEFERYGVPGFVERAREAGLEVVHFPIKDVDTPKEAQSGEYAALIERIVGLLGEGKTVVVHCRGGLGRTGTVAASVLVALGHDPDEAIGLVRSVRSERAVETHRQEEYVRSFGRELSGRERAAARRTRPPGARLDRAPPRLPPRARRGGRFGHDRRVRAPGRLRARGGHPWRRAVRSPRRGVDG